MIHRQLSAAIRRTCRQYPILSITGPRQSGKMTLLRNLFPEYRYVNFEDPDSRRYFLEDPRGFLKQYHQYVIFDITSEAALESPAGLVGNVSFKKNEFFY